MVQRNGIAAWYSGDQTIRGAGDEAKQDYRRPEENSYLLLSGGDILSEPCNMFLSKKLSDLFNKPVLLLKL